MKASMSSGETNSRGEFYEEDFYDEQEQSEVPTLRASRDLSKSEEHACVRCKKQQLYAIGLFLSMFSFLVTSFGLFLSLFSQGSALGVLGTGETNCSSVLQILNISDDVLVSWNGRCVSWKDVLRFYEALELSNDLSDALTDIIEEIEIDLREAEKIANQVDICYSDETRLYRLIFEGIFLGLAICFGIILKRSIKYMKDLYEELCSTYSKKCRMQCKNERWKQLKGCSGGNRDRVTKGPIQCRKRWKQLRSCGRNVWDNFTKIIQDHWKLFCFLSILLTIIEYSLPFILRAASSRDEYKNEDGCLRLSEEFNNVFGSVPVSIRFGNTCILWSDVEFIYQALEDSYEFINDMSDVLEVLEKDAERDEKIANEGKLCWQTSPSRAFLAVTRGFLLIPLIGSSLLTLSNPKAALPMSLERFKRLVSEKGPTRYSFANVNITDSRHPPP